MIHSSQRLWIPTPLRDEQSGLWQWYGNISIELERDHLSRVEADKMKTYYEEAGLLTSWKVDFFRRHFCDTFSRAVSYLLGGRYSPSILDLGCGTGTQAIYFALMGAKVVGVDMDAEALEILLKRKALYEELSGKVLEIEVLERSVFDIDYSALAPVDGVYSMFAFNMMQPSSGLLSMLEPVFSDDARVAIIDGNRDSWLSRLVPTRRRSVWSPREFAEGLSETGFTVVEHRGGISIPPPFWKIAPSLMRPLDDVLNRHWFFPISHQILAKRQRGA